METNIFFMFTKFYSFKHNLQSPHPQKPVGDLMKQNDKKAKKIYMRWVLESCILNNFQG